MSGVHVRDMTEHDIRAVSTLRVTGWQTAYRGIIPDDYLDGLSVEADAERRGRLFLQDSRIQNLVVEDDQGVTGWGALGPCRDDDAADTDGEIYALYVAPARIGTGVGRALMAELVGRAEKSGFTALTLWVLAENHRARRFYERAGFRFDGSQTEWPVGGISVPEVRYARSLENPL
ncbi:GNAT family N-acetyltransferase [Sphaerimonospora cavernae]|uniref:GNAT family N-acetyltransferase n=1 Tax=Sphaerimonospora cavernae TaxID=1740611 RepID=A0ABV6U897_9ACTN